VGGKGKGREGKKERMWKGPESGLPRGPCWLSAGLGLGSAVCSPRPQKHFWNILSPEVVSVATMLVVFFAPTSFLDKLAFEKSASMF